MLKTTGTAAASRRRIIGLDPGLRRTGWGVIDVSGNRLSHVGDGVVASDSAAPLAERLVTLYRGLIAVLERYSPDEASVEETFVNKNAVSTLKLGLARGVVLLAPAERGLVVTEYSATAVKKAIVGTGRAEKAQIQMMVARLLPMVGTNGSDGAERKADAADALAIAICHAHHAASRNWSLNAASLTARTALPPRTRVLGA